MKQWRLPTILVAVLFLLLSCNFLTGSSSGLEDPGGLSAQATSPGSVALTWNEATGADGYRVLAEAGRLGFIPIAELRASQTSFEDFMAPPGSPLTYRVQTIQGSDASGGATVTVNTPPAQPDPLEVVAQFDDQLAAGKMIGPNGGSLSVEDQNGVQYRLDIPAGAVESDTPFTLTPLRSIDGWPLDGKMLGAVQIQPEGLDLYEIATLTISAAAESPTDGLVPVGFAFEGGGQEFHLQPLLSEATPTSGLPSGGAHLASVSLQRGSRQIAVSRTGSRGAGTVSRQGAADISRQHAPSSSAARGQQQAAAQNAAEEELAPVPPPLTPYDKAKREVEVYRPLRSVLNQISSIQDCRDAHSAIGSVQGWLHTASTSAVVPEVVSRGQDVLLGDLAEKIRQVIDDAVKKCKKGEGSSASGAPCAYGLVRRVAAGESDFYKELQSRMLKEFGTDYLAQASAALKSCIKAFEVSGGANASWSGTICNIEKPFVLEARRPAGTLPHEFTPGSNPMSGTWIYWNPASGGGIDESGGGTYSVTLTDSGGSIAISGQGTITGPDISATFDAGDRFTLTWRPPC